MMTKKFINISAGRSDREGVAFRWRDQWCRATRLPDGTIETVLFKNAADTHEHPKLIPALVAVAIASTLAQYAFTGVAALSAANVVACNLAAATVVLWPANNEDIRRNHGAEHKVLNAFKYARPLPKLESVRAVSRLHDNCGTGVLVLALSYLAPLSALACVSKAPILLAFAATYLALKRTKTMPTNWLMRTVNRLTQRLVTDEPTDREIEMAMAAMERLVAVAEE
jgi:uncharacterized protein YqhQ